MSHCLDALFGDRDRQDRFARLLPTAFDIVRQRMPRGNPAVGIVRQHIIVGFLVADFGAKQVLVPELGTTRGFNVMLGGEKLSISTVTKNAPVKVLWTADTQSVEREIGPQYQPVCDMLLVNIFWQQERPSVFWIPLEVQQDVLEDVGLDNFLQAPTGTNHRGISIPSRTMTVLKSHSNTRSLSVSWIPKQSKHPKPWEEWTEFWQQRQQRR